MLSSPAPAPSWRTVAAFPLTLTVVLASLAGCSSPGEGGVGGDGAGGAGGDGGGGRGAGAGSLTAANVTSPHFGGAPYTRDYSGVVREDPAALEGIPTGLARGPFQSCCYFSWVEAPDLFVAEQLSALRVTLSWTNTQQDMANLDVAVCVPWYCGFPGGPDESDQAGPHSETFDLVSGGHRQFLDQDQQYLVGVRYSNLVSVSGVPFTLHAEVVPVADALASLDPYEVAVPANATLVAEIAAPFRAEGSAGVMVYGEDDRPMAYQALDGPNGTRADLATGPGRFVVVPFTLDGAHVRLTVNSTAGGAAAPAPAARRLQETFGNVVVATVADPAPRAGTFTFEAPPGSMDTFPWFIYDGAAAQYPGVGDGAISLASSLGTIAEVRLTAIGAVTPLGQSCLTCGSAVDWTPGNYIDDDGTYEVAYSSAQATGSFVLFTATYSR